MMAVEIVAFAVAGVFCGLMSMKLTDKLIKDRITPDMGNVVKINIKTAPYIWAVVMALGFSGICLTVGSYVNRIEYAVVFCIAACVAMVDISIKRIPNQLLMAFLAIKILSIIINACLGNFSLGSVTSPLIGLAAGFLIFLIPSLMHLNVGAGDIKYGAVIGFYFGFWGYLQVMVFMGVSMLLYFLYLLISRKGGLKTSVAMGPFMSIGTMLTCMFPIVQGMSQSTIL